ncbi:unnamed protein product [Cochlearia groenlandica]
MTTTRSDSDVQEPQIPENSSILMEDSALDSLKIVSFPPLENDSDVEISPVKKSKSSPLASVSENDEGMNLSDSVEVPFSETSSLFHKEPMAMDVECPVENRVCEESQQIKETLSETISEISDEESRVCEESQQIKESLSETISEISVEESRVCVHKIEEVVVADGSFVSVSDVKESVNSEMKEQDSDVQKILEAEKRRLLAEIEVGTIFKKMDHVETISVASNDEKIERVRVKDNAFVGRSVNIDLVDDTALLNVVPFHKKSKDHGKRVGALHVDKDAPRKHKKVGEKKPLTEEVSEANGKKKKVMYSIKQMKSMRYAQLANQKKLWSEIYARLLPELVTEYEGLVSLKNQKTSRSNPRETGIGILGTKEEEEEEYVEDKDDYTSILRPAFEVNGEPDFDSGPPEDGLEYLRRVRWEAKRIPNVRVAKIDETKYVKQEQSVYMPQIPDISKCPEHLLPVKEWEDSLLSDFSHLRLALSQDANEYEDEITPSQSVEDVLVKIFDNRLHAEMNESLGGVVSDIKGMDSVTRVTRLKKRVSLVEKESGLQSIDCKWVVALCASVDTPLDADTCASLRALVRKCASLRALEVEDEQVIVMANMLITIAGKYFGQME